MRFAVGRAHKYIMKFKFIFTIFLFCALPSTRAANDTLWGPGLMLNASLLTLIDIFDGPALRMGAEYKPAGRFSYCLDAKGYFYFPSNFVQKSEVKGYAFTPAVKLYFKKGIDHKGWMINSFVILEYAYKNQAYTTADIEVTQNARPVYSPYRMHQYTNTLTLCYGEMFYDKGPLVIDWYVGVGVRFFSSSSSLGPSQQPYDYHDWTTDLTYIPATWSGHHVLPTLALGIKWAYRLF